MYLDFRAAQGPYLGLTAVTLKIHRAARWYFLQQHSGVCKKLDLTSAGIFPGKHNEAKEGKGVKLTGKGVIKMLEIKE